MSVSLVVNDTKLTERLIDPYNRIDETYPLGMMLTNFMSLSEDDFKKGEHIYLRLTDNEDGHVNGSAWFYDEMKCYIDMMIEDPSIGTIDTFMFFLRLSRLNVPAHRIHYDLDQNWKAQKIAKPLKTGLRIEKAIKAFAALEKDKTAMSVIYECETVEEVCMGSLYHLIKSGLLIKACGNCGKYFVPLLRSDAIYCDRTSPYNPNRTCKEDGSQRAFEKKLQDNEVEKLRRNVYQIKQMRVRRNPDIPFYKENFDQWKADVALWKRDVESGTRTNEAFILWLQESKRK